MRRIVGIMLVLVGAVLTAPADARTIGGWSLIGESTVGFGSGCVTESFGTAAWAGGACSIEIPLPVDTSGTKTVTITFSASRVEFIDGLEINLYGMTSTGVVNSQAFSDQKGGTQTTVALTAEVPDGGYMYVFFTGGLGDQIYSINWNP